MHSAHFRQSTRLAELARELHGCYAPEVPGIGRKGCMKVEVQFYAGGKADEKPLRFRMHGREYLVEEMIDQWYGPDHAFFKLRADDGNLYILRHHTSTPDGDWELVSFRQIA